MSLAEYRDLLLHHDDDAMGPLKDQEASAANEETSSDYVFNAEPASSSRVDQYSSTQSVGCSTGPQEFNISPETTRKDTFDSQDGLMFQGGPLVSPATMSLDGTFSSPVLNSSYLALISPASFDLMPSPSKVLSNSSLSIVGAFEFPEDYTYFQYSVGGSFSSISRVLSLAELFQAEAMSSHVYNAAIALAALTLSNSEAQPTNSKTLRLHAFQHSLKAIQGLQNDLPNTGKIEISMSSTSLHADAALSLFTTIILAANFELQRNCVLLWRTHMRGAASFLSAAYTELIKKDTGMLLIRAFSRMALLIRLYNEEYSVTTSKFMPEYLATWLNELLRDSSSLHDRILLFVEEVTALEIQKLQHPSLKTAWAVKSTDLLHRLEQWRNDLPPSDIPVDDHTGASLTLSSTLICIPALHFPNSPDPFIAAVNYASYLCTCMRTRTRYRQNHNDPNTTDRILPPETEQTALTICRIAASIPPSCFGDSFTYSYGMLPSVVGAYCWSSNPSLRAWAKHWLMGYRTTKEGIFNVVHTLKFIAIMDEKGHG